MTTDPTLDATLSLARRLSYQDRIRLIARLADELTMTPKGVPATTQEADTVRTTLADLRAYFSSLGPEVPTLGDQLDRDRRDRDDMLHGSGSGDVHP